ncbi:MAG: RluA family pseudouridine synthase [Chloroflexi bacterium]|nr:RluA family pseudouridine synthase [Chloroflexota bacterium]
MTLEPQLLYQDEDLIALNKPPGLATLVEGWNPERETAMSWAQARFGKVYLVHRLDKVTSGLLLFARTPEAHRSLSLQFETRKVLKRYQALLIGEPAWETQTVALPLRVGVGRRHRTIVAAQGKAAETFFRVLARLPGYTWVEAQPHTGRTHQIRAHAAAIGHPLLGDTLYGAPPSALIQRPALHAWSLTFIHPRWGKEQTLQAPLAADILQALETPGMVPYDPQSSHVAHSTP